VAKRDQYHNECDRKIDEKHGAPRNVLEHAGGYGIGLDYARDMIKPA